MKRLRHALLPLLLGFSAVLISPGSASAGFLTGFTGYTQMSLTSSGGAASVNGVVDFAVYQNDGGSWAANLAVLGAGPAVSLAGLDLTAAYVYLYEVVNNGTQASIDVLKISSGPAPYTSAGYLADTIFTDGDGKVGPSGNQFLGPNPGSTPPGDILDGVPTQSGVSAPGFSSPLSGGKPPLTASLGGAGPEAEFASIQWGNSGSPTTLGLGQYSTVVFLTSNTAPVYARGDIRDGGDPAVGDVPAQAPEPSALVLCGLGVLGLAGSRGWRRWRGQA